MEKYELPGWVALSVLGALALVGILAWKPPTNSEGVAAWVQAFGSIAALSGAVWLTDRARRRDQEDRRRDLHHKEIKAVNRVLAAAERIVNQVSSLETAFESHSAVASSDLVDDLNASLEMLRFSLDGVDEAGGVWVHSFEVLEKVLRVREKALSLLALQEKSTDKGAVIDDELTSEMGMATAVFKIESSKLIGSALSVRMACRAFIENPSTLAGGRT